MEMTGRKAALMVVALGIALSASIFVPVIPVTITRSSSAICPPGTVGLCSIGDGSLTLGGFGSLTYRLVGVGGALWQGRFQLLQDGCHTTAFAHQSVEDLVCTQ